jgi:uncharacterized caspase-like protein
MRALRQVLIGLALLGLASGNALADKRVALVIGNSAYQNVAKLPNPVNDAEAIAKLFTAAGFQVELRRNLGGNELRRAIREFSRQTLDADVAVVFYAGHGIEVGGNNYLIPTDAKLESDIDVVDEAVPLDRVLTMIEPATRLQLIILDACRDNPFLKAMKRTMASRGIGRGLAQVEPASSNTLIAFAAKAGSLAIDDAGGTNSPFTAALLNHLTTPGLDLRLALGRVRDEVLRNTRQMQEPFVYGSLGGESISLVPAPEPKRVEAAPLDPIQQERRDYELAERVGTMQAWSWFLEHHAAGFYADLAEAQRQKLIELVEHAGRAEREEQLKRGEEANKAAEVARLEELRKSEAAKRAEELRRAGDAKNAAEAERLEKLHKIEDAKRAEELRKAQEEARMAREAAKAAEERRLAALKTAEEARKEADAVKKQADIKKAAEGPKIAALPKSEKPLGPAAFDGTWRIVRLSKNCWDKNYSFSVAISGSMVSGHAGAGAVRGFVSKSGVLRFTHPSNPGLRPKHYSGTLNASGGSGTFTTEGVNCNGTFTASR